MYSDFIAFDNEHFCPLIHLQNRVVISCEYLSFVRIISKTFTKYPRLFIIFLVVASDYECLTQMNTAAVDKYNHMHRKLQHINNSIRTMNDANCK
jgi:hypothetical protein